MLSNSRTEPQATLAAVNNDTTTTPGRPASNSTTAAIQPRSATRVVSPPAPHYSDARRQPQQPPRSPTPQEFSSFKVEQEEDDDDDRTLPWPLSGQEQLHEESTARPNMPETPRKAAKSSALATPGKRRYTDVDLDDISGLMTPVTGRRDRDQVNYPELGATSSLRTGATHMNTGGGSIRSPDQSPLSLRSGRMRDLEPVNDQLMIDVFEILEKQNVFLNTDTSNTLKQVLSRHSLRATGIAKG